MLIKEGIIAALILASSPGIYETMKSRSSEILAQISSQQSRELDGRGTETEHEGDDKPKPGV